MDYDPGLGFLPQDDPAHPWLADIQPGTQVSIVDGKLQIVGATVDAPAGEVDGAQYQRLEPPLIGPPPSPIYIIEATYDVGLIYPGGDSEETLAMLGVMDGERLAVMSLGRYQGQRVVVHGEDIEAGAIIDPDDVRPWDFRNETTYTLVVQRGVASYLLVNDQPVMVRDYDTLPTGVPPTIAGEGVFGFSSAHSSATYSRVRYCVCSGQTAAEPPLVGPEGKIAVGNLRDSPDPFRPAVEQSELQLDLQALELPGLPSGQFEFTSRVVWEIVSPELGYLERTLTRQDTLGQLGTYPLALQWDGQDAADFGLPAGVYPYRVRVDLVREKTRGKKTKARVFDSVVSPWRSVTVLRYAPRVSVYEPMGTPTTTLEVGDSLHVGVTDLEPRTAYDLYLTPEDPAEVSVREAISYARLVSDGDGEIPPFILWYQSGVEGCGLNPVPGRESDPYRFERFEEAEMALEGRRLRVSIYPAPGSSTPGGNGNPGGGVPPPRTDPPAATLKVPVTSRTRPLVYPSLQDGCLIHSRPARTEDLYVSGQGFPPYEELTLSLVPHQWIWKEGDPIQDLTGSPAELRRVVTDANGRFTTRLWEAGQQHFGTFDVVAHPPPPVPGPDPGELPLEPSLSLESVVSFPLETGVVYLPPTQQARPVDLVVRPYAISQSFPFSSGTRPRVTNAFTAGDTVYAALDPLSGRGGILSGDYAAMHIVPHRPAQEWNLALLATTPIIDPGHVPPYEDPSLATEIVPIKDAWFSGPVPIWNGPLVHGKWDVVANFIHNPSNPAPDNLFDAGVDFLDGASRPGFVVTKEPIERGPYSVACGEYLTEDMFIAYSGSPDYEITVDLSGKVCLPVDPSITPPSFAVAQGRHPLFLIQHGHHSACSGDDPLTGYPLDWDSCGSLGLTERIYSYRGYDSLLHNLASHGIIAVSIDAHDYTYVVDAPGLDDNLERGNLFLWHLRWWAHLDDPNTYDGPIVDFINPPLREFDDSHGPVTFMDPFQPSNSYQSVELNGLIRGHVDLSRVSISGHSKGGEATRYAYSLNKTVPYSFGINSISAIAPSSMTWSMLDQPSISDVPYFVIIAASDCEIECCPSVEQYNRSLDSTTKSGIYIYGANHEWFNTVWAADVTDYWNGDDCYNYNNPEREFFVSKEKQSEVATAHLAAFTRVHLTHDFQYEDMLRGLSEYPSTEGVRLYHLFHHENHIKIEDGGGGSLSAYYPSSGTLDTTILVDPLTADRNLELFGNTGRDSAVLKVHWQVGGWLNISNADVPYLEYSGPWDVSALKAISFRAAWTDAYLAWTPPSSPETFQWLTVELESAGITSEVGVWEYGTIPEPYNHPMPKYQNNPFNVMLTVRIPLQAFLGAAPTGFDFKQIDAIRLKFYYPLDGEIYFDDLEFSQ